MKFTATDKYLAYARGAVKTLTWRVYVRSTATLSAALSSGTWTEVTQYLDLDQLPEVSSSIEYEPGQFTADSLKLIARGITFWKALFNTTDYLELKVMVTLGQSGDEASDTVYAFSGFIDPAGIEYNELEDSVLFEIYTADEYAGRAAAENLSTQYINPDIDGSGTSGLAFHTLTGLFIKDAGISSYDLKVGTHTLTYDYTGRRAKLDAGAWVPLANGDNVLGDAATGGTDAQRLKVYVTSVLDLPTTTQPITEKVIVINSGDTLPRQWYRYTSVEVLLRKIFDQLGITSVLFDELVITSWDNSARISFVDYPPADDAIQGAKTALVADPDSGAGLLYIAIGNTVYKKTMSTGAYTLVTTIASGSVISRLFTNNAGTHLWIYYGTSVANPDGFLRRYNFLTSTLGGAITLSNSSKHSIQLVEGGGGEYSLIYVDSVNHTVRRVDGTTPLDAVLFSQATLGYTGAYGPQDTFAYVKSTIKYRFLTSTAVAYKTHEVEYTGGVWVDNGQIASAPELYKIAAYHVIDDTVYYYRRQQVLGDNYIHYIFRHPATSITNTLLATLDQAYRLTNEVEAMLYTADGVYFTTIKGHLYKADSYVLTLEHTAPPRVFSKYYALAYLGDILYGLDDLGKLFQYSPSMAMYVPIADFTGRSIRDALNETLRAFNLIGNISSQKTAAVYRRGDSSGTPQTSGHTISGGASLADQLIETSQHSPAADYVEVSNGVITTNYNGTAFDTTALSSAKKISLNSPLIPDELVADLCYVMYQFFKTARSLYRVSLGCVPLFQYETFDEGELTFTTTKIPVTGSGPIYAVRLQREGGLVLEVLI